jgi:hypothetical protein
VDLSPLVTPWAIMAGFVTALGSVVIYGIRRLVKGDLVPGNLHGEVRTDRDTYKKAVETALATNAQLAASVDRLTSSVDLLIRTTNENQLIMRQIVARLPWPNDKDAVT